MISAQRLGAVRCLLLCAMFILMGALTTTTAHADLPSSVASRVKRINTAIDAIDTALQADRLTTAQRKLKEANRYLKEINDRYSGKFDEADTDYQAMVERLAAATAKVKAAEAGAADATAAGAAVEAAKKALCKEWIDKLDPFTDYDSDQYLRIGAQLNRASPEEQAQSKAAFARARVLFAEYQAIEFPHGKTTDLQNLESRLASALEYYGEMEAKAAQKEACQEWVDQLRPYVDSGMGSRKWLIAAPTLDSQQLAEQQKLYEEAEMVFAAYQQAEFPLGKTFRLETLEESMKKVLKEFPQAVAQSHAMMSGDIGARLDSVIKYMNRDTGWKGNDKKKPPVIMERDLKPLREGIDRFAGTADSDDPKLAELRRKLKAIEDTNADHRVVRAERTFQQPDGYTGSDIKDLQRKAEEVATKAYPKCRIQHITVPSEEWAIENVLEYMDTTKTALRRRITRCVRAEVALADADGKVWLQEIYLGQDRMPDSRWGKLKGHTTWADPMVEDNLGEFVEIEEPQQTSGS